MLPLARAARDAGHDVLFTTGPDQASRVAAAGFDVAVAGLSFAESTARYAPLRAEAAGLDQADRLTHLFIHAQIGIAAPAMCEDLLPRAGAWRPDLVVSNHAEPAGGVIAAVQGIGYVTHGLGPPKAAQPKEREALAGLFARFGADPAAAAVPGPYLDIWPRAAHPVVETWAYPDMWSLRPEAVMPMKAPRPAVLDDLPYERTVYVTLGTTYNTRQPGVLESMVEALREEPVNVVATTGPGTGGGTFGPLPAHVRIESFVPQAALLPHVDAVLCHAGSGTVLGALAHGVPVACHPLAADQYETAACLTRAGAGAEVPEDSLSTDAVREAVRRILDSPSYAEAARHVAAQMRTMPSPASMVDRLAAHTW
jgi:UDP:flavonoid glycosyltransferase YjiC (YdhE family)